MIGPDELNHPIVDKYMLVEMNESQNEKEARFNRWFNRIDISSARKIPY